MNIQYWRKFKTSTTFKRRVNRNKLKLFKSGGESILSSNCDQQLENESNVASIHLNNEIPVSISDSDTSDDQIISEESEIATNNWILELDINDESNSNITEIDLREELRKWAIKYNIRHQALSGLLKTLIKVVPKAELPIDPRTLLFTPPSVIFNSVGDGLYWHQGLENCLKQYFSTLDRSINISLNFNIDGLPIYKSSKLQFWPILFNVFEIKDFKPMVIGIYCGKGKPSNLYDFLKMFVDETKEILANGIFIKNHKINVRIRCFICDSPARAYIKGVTYFNGKHGCLKCTVVGEYIKNCTVFLQTECTRRTDNGFRNKIYGPHHKLTSPIEELSIDMVEDFPIGDSLHLIDLGIVKKCLTGWTHGDFKGTEMRFCAKDIEDITNKLNQIKLPPEIHRTVRGLDSLAYWKGTEYRTFLYYLGIVVLKDHLRYDAYEHFLSFFCAITICCVHRYRNFLPLAKALLEHYIEKYTELYKAHSITSNVHNLCHLVEEVEKFGILNTFNAYPFENQLYMLKNLLRTGSCPLAQAAKRIIEISQLEKYEINCIKKYPSLKKRNEDGTFSSITFENFSLTNDMKNKWFLTKTNVIVGLENIFLNNTKIIIKGTSLKSVEDFFVTPINSSHLHIYFSDCEENLSLYYNLNDIKCKLVGVPYNSQGMVFIPLIHTMD